MSGQGLVLSLILVAVVFLWVWIVDQDSSDAQKQTDIVAGVPLSPGPDPAVVAAAISTLPSSPDPRGLNMLVPIVAQAIIDHSIVRTEFRDSGAICHPIPPELEFFTGVTCIPFMPLGSNPVNLIPLNNMRSSFLYGSGERTRLLRNGNQLAVDEFNMPPKAGVVGVHSDGPSPESQFAVGDIRGGENSFLTVIHAVFVRRHNQFVRDGLSFEQAKQAIEAELDYIVYEEILPALIGPYADCTGVPLVEQIDKTFAGAIFRIHPMINPNVTHHLDFLGTVSLRDMFFNPEPLDLVEGDIGPFVEAMYKTPAFSDDATMSLDLNRFLFFTQPSPAHSLTVLNLMRGEDLQLSDFNSARVAVGLQPYSAFSEVVERADVLAVLEDLYPGGPSTCPIWLCIRAEKAAPGSSIGETGSVWFRNQLCGIRRTPPTPVREPESFSAVVCQTTNVCDLPENSFVVST